MSLINVVSTPPNGLALFNPTVFEFEFSEAGCEVTQDEGSLALRVQLAYQDILGVGDNIRITNGTYAGTYRITTTQNLANLILRITLNAPFTVNGLVSGSNRFIPEVVSEFEIISGYASGPEAIVKPWAITGTARITPNMQGRYVLDVSGYLQSRFRIVAPVPGADPNISIRYTARLKTASALPDPSTGITAYYGIAPLTLPQQQGDEPIGLRPILVFGADPTLYSAAKAQGIVNHFQTSEDPINTASSSVSIQLLSCQPREITWLGSGPTAGFTVDPALPDWIQATAVGNTIELIINPCTGGVADYLAADYSIRDYLTGGQINSVTGCFAFDFELGGNPLFTLNTCVTPVAEIQELCREKALSFAWLNSLGGFSSVTLEGKYTVGREIGEVNTVVNTDMILRRVSMRDVYETYRMSGGVLSKATLDLMQDMRTAIQVYLFNRATQQFDIPIVLEPDAFTTYGNRFNQSETRFSIQFKVAQQLRIQTQ